MKICPHCNKVNLDSVPLCFYCQANLIRVRVIIPAGHRRTCPRCGGLAVGRFSYVVRALCVILFPFGLIALLSGRDYVCWTCGLKFRG